MPKLHEQACYYLLTICLTAQVVDKPFELHRSAWPYAKWVGLVGVGLCAAKVMAGTHFSTKLCNMNY